MSRIALYIEQSENRRLLAEWLGAHHEIAPGPDAPHPSGASPSAFDLAIVDGPSLVRYGAWIDAVKREAEPLFLPLLLVTHRRGTPLSSSVLHKKVDELIVSPVEKIELCARVETLLRVRALSLANAALSLRMTRELERARLVQAGLLPEAAPTIRGFELAARCIPASELGGDFYDWATVGETTTLTVGDVMGKGVPAALLAATVRAVLRALARAGDPGRTLDTLEETLRADLSRTSSFVTLFHARLRSSERELRYVDAGHGHAVIRRFGGGLERLERGGRPIGFPKEHPYREAVTKLMPGDTLFVYSDGLGDEMADPSRTFGSLDTRASAAEMLDRVLKPSTSSRVTLRDDATLLVLKALE